MVVEAGAGKAHQIGTILGAELVDEPYDLQLGDASGKLQRPVEADGGGQVGEQVVGILQADVL